MRDVENLQLYLPNVVAAAVADSTKSAAGEWHPESKEFSAVCLFADVSGFTKLTEELCARGSSGLEDMSESLNKYVTQMVKKTTRAGGDVIKFAGDAMLAIWPVSDDKGYNEDIHRAVQCALDIQETLDNFPYQVYDRVNYEELKWKDGKDAAVVTGHFRMKLGLGLGKVRILHLGGNSDMILTERYEYVAVGSALTEAIGSEEHALPGEVIVNRAIWDRVSDKFVKHSFKKDKKKDGSSRKLPKDRILVDRTEVPVKWKASKLVNDIDNTTERKLWKYVPTQLIPFLIESNDEFWAPELRRVTTLFIDLGFDPKEVAAGKHHELLQEVFSEIQCIVLTAYEGTINKFLLDDKGSTLIVVFGLPPFSHDNDSLRGVLSAMHIVWKLAEFQLKCSVGVSTGLAFCGILGHVSGNRREYSVIGDSVNLAARLMQRAKSKQDPILMDSATKIAVDLSSNSSDFLKFSSTGEIYLKGKSQAVNVFKIQATPNTERRDFHSINMSRLSALSRNSRVVVLSDKSRVHLKTRRRPTADMISEPNDMKMIEESHLKSMNSYGIAARRKNSKKSGDADSMSFRSKSELGFNVYRLIRVELLSSSSSIESFKTTIKLEKASLVTVADLIRYILTKLITKAVVPSDILDRLNCCELKWLLSDGSKITLNHSRELSTLASKSVSDVLDLLFVHKDESSRIYQGPYLYTESTEYMSNGEYITEQLIRSRDKVLSNIGSRMVIIDGETGVGKSNVVETFLEMEDFENEAIICSASGNEFDADGIKQPFAVWQVLLESVFIETQVGGKVHSKEQKIREAVEIAKRGSSTSPYDVSTGHLHLVNDIFGTQFKEEQDLPKPKVSKVGPVKRMSKVLTQNSRVRTIAAMFSPSDRRNSQIPTSPRKSNLPAGRRSKRPEASFTQQASHVTIQLLAAIIAGVAERVPLFFIVDRCNDMDPQSWLVFIELCEHWSKNSIFSVLLYRKASKVVTTDNARVSMVKPGHKKFKSQLKAKMSQTENGHDTSLLHIQLEEMPNVVLCLELQPDVNATFDMVCNIFQVDFVAQDLFEFVEKKAEGRPLFIKETMNMLMQEDLVKRQGSQLIFDEYFKSMDPDKLPVPLQVDGVIGPILDRLTLTQQLLMKVASILDERFSFEMVQLCFPIRPITTEKAAQLLEEWDLLIQSGCIKKSKGLFSLTGWTGNVLRNRMLNKQKAKVFKLKQNSEKKHNEAKMDAFLDRFNANNQSAGSLISHSGKVLVLKGNPKNKSQPWKPRYCELKGKELVQLYDPKTPKRLEVIRVDASTSFISEPTCPIKFDPKLYPEWPSTLFCFSVSADVWEKQGKPRNDHHDFLFACATEQEREVWIDRIQLLIRALKRESTRDTRCSSSLSDDQTTVGTKKSATSRFFKGLQRNHRRRRSSMTDFVELVPMQKAMYEKVTVMLPSFYDKIPRPHDQELFNQCEKLSVVAEFGGSVVGYLMGYPERSSSGISVAVVEAMAVLPEFRKQGIASKMMKFFFSLAKSNGCAYCRVVFTKDARIPPLFKHFKFEKVPSAALSHHPIAPKYDDASVFKNMRLLVKDLSRETILEEESYVNPADIGHNFE